jgi:hypothetical protein
MNQSVQVGDNTVECYFFSDAAGSLLHLDNAIGEAARPDCDPERNSDQFGVGELDTRAIDAIVQEGVESRGPALLVDALARF